MKNKLENKVSNITLKEYERMIVLYKLWQYGKVTFSDKFINGYYEACKREKKEVRYGSR